MAKDTQTPATTGNPQTTTGAAKDKNPTSTPEKAVKSAVTGNTAAMAGPEVSGDKTDKVEEHVIAEGHEDKHADGKITEVKSHIEPTVPEPPAPNPAVGVDLSHPTVDTYPSEEAASEAPGIHMDLSQVVRPTGVVTHAPPPFHRVDGNTPGQGKNVTEGVEDAKEQSEKGGMAGSTVNSGE